MKVDEDLVTTAEMRPAPTDGREDAFAKFRNSVGFQFMFVLHSGLDVKSAKDHVCIAAEKLVADIAQASEWQPIESAPQDGTLILLSEGDYVTPGCWDCDEADEGGQCWRDRVFDADRLTPTRWMPLPAAPALTDPTEATK